MVTLTSSRLVLRGFRADDAGAVLSYRNDPEVALFQGWPQPYDASHFRALLDPTRRLTETGWRSWCVCDSTGVVGDIGLRQDGDVAELGITLARHAHGRGYAAEALERVTAYAGQELHVRRLRAGVNPANEAVVALLLRCGWRLRTTEPKAYWHRDHWDDEATYVRDDLVSSSAAGELLRRADPTHCGRGRR